MKVGETFEEKIKILRGVNNDRKPIVEDGIIKWKIVEVYDKVNFLAKNKEGEYKTFTFK